VGAFAMLRWLKKGRKSQEISIVNDGDPAEALRAKLEESRTVADEPPSEPPPADPDARRRDVHEAARARLEELKHSGSDEG